MKTIFFTVTAIALLSLSQYRQIGLEQQIDLHKIESQVLRDQLADLSQIYSTRKTYEQGLEDGLRNSKNEDFVRGYHAASEQFSVPTNVLAKD
jgi:hypothetical protein